MTMRFVGVEIVGALGGRSDRHVLPVTGVSTDTRTLQPGQIYFALAGHRCDGHDYAAQALAKGAAAAVVHRDVDVPEAVRDRLVRVPDTLRALGESARLYRRRWGGRVVAITGSNGKTTTREMLYHILSGAVRCKRSPKSFNTNVGVPLTLFLAEPGDEALIVEMGTNAPGEIRELAAIAEPDHAVITSVAESHLEGLGSVEGVARAKGELLESLGARGTAILNADEPWLDFFRALHPAPVVTFGLDPAANLRASRVRPQDGGFAFGINGGTQVRLGVPGMHNVRNALAALAAAHVLDMDLPAAALRLASFRLPDLRLQVEDIGGVRVIADCYNANPGSMRAALETLRDTPAEGRRIAVLGDMLELGPAGESLHAQLGASIAGYGVQCLWAVGPLGAALAAAAQEHGLSGAAYHAADAESAASALADLLRPGDVVLVKGSRGMAMERVVDHLKHAALASA